MNKDDIDKDTFPTAKKLQSKDLLAVLPEYLKDPANYQKIRKEEIDILASRCGHSDPLEWHACSKCSARIRDHAEFLRKLGFINPAQYYAWRKTHEYIEKRVRLPKYNG